MTGTLRWFKSSYSSASGGECLEVAYAWRKSSYSDSGGGACVEVAPCPQAVSTAIHIRDSKNPDGPNLTVSGKAWAAFISSPAYQTAGCLSASYV
ncbi:DUF397 domain-containing protein [Streptomyces sp. DT2A-34]|uniref:DUF397 domain-containing protein n=1 Tax=Streptomyces sp. DT2A-34 TaxID=3051182 RepID=UPI00265C5BA9|nr:DUF397 domain-containing protein [Streptomyces sp. DT2A-34]MDO0913110.1 DUF397 domain-containing protein [Streptomyces sp. DT2A-34]